MSKREQVLQIEPQSELRFKGPFNVPVTSYMKLTNPTDRDVMFKIKTTAPRKYCVRPNAGILQPNKTSEISICLQPFLFDPAEKNKHKFMVQTVFAPPGVDGNNLDQYWREISPDKLMDSKLKCVFDLPEEQNENGTVTKEGSDASPKPAGRIADGSSVEAELQKAAQEVQQLREEESLLRQENLRLKEQILSLKYTLEGNSSKTAPVNRYAPPAPEQQIPMMYIALAVLLALIGILIGKFAL